MKLSVTIVLLSIASYAFAQNPIGDSRSTKIDEDERKRLENQFKALNNFYINDDGLVVYQTQGNSTTPAKEATSVDTTSSASNAPKNVKSEKSESNYLINENNEATKSMPTEQKPISKQAVSATASPIQTEAVTQEKAPVRSTVIRKEALKPTEATSNRETASNSPVTEANQETGIKSGGIKNSPITVEQDNSPKTSKNTNQANTGTNSSKATQPKLTSTKSSVFDKNKRPSQYKTMEEAALAVEALLDDLRKEQAQTTSAGSMSSRLSGGAGRTTLRKKPSTNPSYSSTNSDNTASAIIQSASIIENEDSEFGTEPTYYINGKEVDKIEVNKLRKKEIINKEVRTRNTVSGNPNGEVWYEVKYEN